MKTNFKYLAMMLTAGLFMASCSNNEVENLIPKTKGEPVQFQMGVTDAVTRTTTGSDYVTTFVTGDAVGIFAYERASDGSDGASVVTNAKYVLGADKNWTVEGSEGIYAESGKTFNYYAYYPYQAGVTDPASIGITVKADQSVEADYNVSDALTAKNITVTAGTPTVPLTFHHAFALVQVNLKGSLADKDAVVTMQNVYPTAKLNTQTEVTANAEGTLGTIKMYPMPGNQDAGATQFAYRAIVPAQTVATGVSLLEITSAGKTYKFTYSEGVTYDAAKIRIMNVTLGESGQNTITIPASDTTIDNWGNSGAGTGTGTVEEVIEAVTTFTPELTATTTFTEYVNYSSSTSIIGSTDFWFHREHDGNKTSQTDTKLSIIDESGTSVIKAVVATLPVSTKGWNNSSFGYHCASLFAKTTYKVTFKAKANIASGIVGISVRDSKDAKAFQIMKESAPTESWERNVTTKTLSNVADTYLNCTFYFNLNMSSSLAKASGMTASDFSATQDDEVKGINIYLYNYKASELYIKDLKIEKNQ